MKTTLACLALLAAPPLVQAQDNCTSPNSNDDYILGVVDGVASAMHWDSGLVWKRCSEGQVFGAGECTGTAQAKNWNTWAEAYLPQSFTGQSSWGISEGLSQNLLHSGAWRMAYKNELLRITANCQSKPFVNQEVFPDTPANSFWSGSPVNGYPNDARLVDFNDATNSIAGRSNSNYVRLVRGGEFFAGFSPVSTSGPAGQQKDFAPITLATSTGTGQAWGGGAHQRYGRSCFSGERGRLGATGHRQKQ